MLLPSQKLSLTSDFFAPDALVLHTGLVSLAIGKESAKTTRTHLAQWCNFTALLLRPWLEFEKSLSGVSKESPPLHHT